MPELIAPDDAIVRVDVTGVCGSDLHIYHGRLKIEPGFTIGHEYVGTVVEAGEAVNRVKVGDRVAGCFLTACGTCFHCMRGEYQRCMEARSFGLGGTMGSLRAPRRSSRSCRTPTWRCARCPTACPTTSRCSPAT